MSKILNYGSINVDESFTVPHICLSGETLSSTDYVVRAGGKGTLLNSLKNGYSDSNNEFRCKSVDRICKGKLNSDIWLRNVDWIEVCDFSRLVDVFTTLATLDTMLFGYCEGYIIADSLLTHSLDQRFHERKWCWHDIFKSQRKRGIVALRQACWSMFLTFCNREMGVHSFKSAKRRAITVSCSIQVLMALILWKKLLLCSNPSALATGSCSKMRSAMVATSWNWQLKRGSTCFSIQHLWQRAFSKNFLLTRWPFWSSMSTRPKPYTRSLVAARRMLSVWIWQLSSCATLTRCKAL